MVSGRRAFAIPLILLAACGKSASERVADVENCSAVSANPATIARCLKDQGGWSAAAADSAAAARLRELDTLNSQLGALSERADSQHAGEVRACDQRLVDLKTCLITRFGWEEDKAGVVDDSVWNSRSTEHERQIRSCAGRRGVGAGACLQLHYKWLPRRALALDDSIRRANIR
jgi:hypothetical protein